jgi:hypothetical protein
MRGELGAHVGFGFQVTAKTTKTIDLRRVDSVGAGLISGKPAAGIP